MWVYSWTRGNNPSRHEKAIDLTSNRIVSMSRSLAILLLHLKEKDNRFKAEGRDDGYWAWEYIGLDMRIDVFFPTEQCVREVSWFGCVATAYIIISAHPQWLEKARIFVHAAMYCAAAY